VIQGAEFFAIVKHRLMDEKTRNAFFADLRAAYLGAEVKAGVEPASAYDPFR
jgi:hypothetical protein